MDILGVIPSRYGSTRFPGKPLADIGGKSMVQRVYEQASQASRLSEVVVATDDERIYDHVLGFGGKVVMTASDHQSGTDRCQEALEKHGGDFHAVVNIQGDEPFILPSQIDALAACFDVPDAQLATLVKEIDSPEVLIDPNKVKAVVAENGEALYFSRQPLPYRKGLSPEKWLEAGPHFLHIGIYGYRSDVLKEITQLPPSPLELAESLEQLRWLDHGYRIQVRKSDFESRAVDTPEDLARIRAELL